VPFREPVRLTRKGRCWKERESVRPAGVETYEAKD